MTAFMTPTTMPEWMNQVNRRLAVIERHRHGDMSVTPPEQDITTNKWFRASVATNAVIPIGVDGLVKVPLSDKADPYGMLDAQYRFAHWPTSQPGARA